MPHNLVVIIALTVPVLAMVLLRINASMVFLSLWLATVGMSALPCSTKPFGGPECQG